MDKWKKITEEKLMTKHHTGFLIIKPLSQYDHVPIDCPVCKFVMRDNRDLMAYQRNECCRDCELKWAEPHRTKWKNGWRPGTKSGAE